MHLRQAGLELGRVMISFFCLLFCLSHHVLLHVYGVYSFSFRGFCVQWMAWLWIYESTRKWWIGYCQDIITGDWQSGGRWRWIRRSRALCVGVLHVLLMATGPSMFLCNLIVTYQVPGTINNRCIRLTLVPYLCNILSHHSQRAPSAPFWPLRAPPTWATPSSVV